MDLREKLGEELFGKVQAALGNNESLIINDGSFIPRQRLNEKNERIDALERQLKDRDEQIDALKADSQASKELQNKIEELQEANNNNMQEMEEKLNQHRLEAGIEKELIKTGARNPRAVKSLLDYETLKVADDRIKGLEEQLSQIKESDPYLFEEGGSKSAGSEGFTGEETSPLTAERIEQMSEKEINDNWEEIQTFLENNG